jgi:hypothetical protein
MTPPQRPTWARLPCEQQPISPQSRFRGAPHHPRPVPHIPPALGLRGDQKDVQSASIEVGESGCCGRGVEEGAVRGDEAMIP